MILEFQMLVEPLLIFIVAFQSMGILGAQISAHVAGAKFQIHALSVFLFFFTEIFYILNQISRAVNPIFTVTVNPGNV